MASNSNISRDPDWDLLMGFQHNHLYLKCLSDDVVFDKDNFEHLFVELKKFFYLSSKSKLALPMTSIEVDNIWHQFILFTRDYFDFCEHIFGRYLHHSPNVKSDKTPSKDSLLNFVALYQLYFGEMDDIWHINSTRIIHTYYNLKNNRRMLRLNSANMKE